MHGPIGDCGESPSLASPAQPSWEASGPPPITSVNGRGLGPILMAVAGLGMYVHPVTAIPLAFAVWLGFWVYRGRRPWKLFLPYLVACGLCFVATAGPYFWHYLSLTEHGTVKDPALTHEIVKTYFGRAYVDQVWFLGNFAKQITLDGVLPLGLLGMGTLVCLRRQLETRRLLLFGMWFVGILIVAIAIPLAEQVLARIAGTKPTQYSLFRSIRLTIPFFMFFAVYAAYHAMHVRPRKLGAGLILLALLVAVIASGGDYQPDVLDESLPVLLNGSQGRDPAFGAAIDALRSHTPPSATILPIGINANTVRFATQRPLRFTRKDVVLVYSDQSLLAHWYPLMQRYEEILERPASSRKAQALTDFARDVGAQYIFIHDEALTPDFWKALVSPVWSGNGYAIYHVNSKTSHAVD